MNLLLAAMMLLPWSNPRVLLPRHFASTVKSPVYRGRLTSRSFSRHTRTHFSNSSGRGACGNSIGRDVQF